METTVSRGGTTGHFEVHLWASLPNTEDQVPGEGRRFNKTGTNLSLIFHHSRKGHSLDKGDDKK
jgi:hypothetical protein